MPIVKIGTVEKITSEELQGIAIYKAILYLFQLHRYSMRNVKFFKDLKIHCKSLSQISIFTVSIFIIGTVIIIVIFYLVMKDIMNLVRNLLKRHEYFGKSYPIRVFEPEL